MLVRVYTCQNATLLEIPCHGSNLLLFYSYHEVQLHVTSVIRLINRYYEPCCPTVLPKGFLQINAQ